MSTYLATPVAAPTPVAVPMYAPANERAEPEWLTAYPRAKVHKEFVNPFDEVSIPLTQPAVNATRTRYAVQAQGKVTMLQYAHQPNDSPLLIQRHYDALLAQQGYERVIACATPCPGSGGSAFWTKMLDPVRNMDYWMFPDAPLVLIGYKADAVAFVAVGKNHTGAGGAPPKLWPDHACFISERCH